MTRLATSFVVMASTSLLLLLTLSQVLKIQVLYCGRVLSDWQVYLLPDTCLMPSQ